MSNTIIIVNPLKIQDMVIVGSHIAQHEIIYCLFHGRAIISMIF